MAADNLADRERVAAVTAAELEAIEAEYQTTKRALMAIAGRLTEARAAAEKASGRVHLARLRAMLAGG